MGEKTLEERVQELEEQLGSLTERFERLEENFRLAVYGPSAEDE